MTIPRRVRQWRGNGGLFVLIETNSDRQFSIGEGLRYNNREATFERGPLCQPTIRL